MGVTIPDVDFEKGLPDVHNGEREIAERHKADTPTQARHPMSHAPDNKISPTVLTVGGSEANLRLTSKGERQLPGGVPARGLPADGPAVPDAGVPGDPLPAEALPLPTDPPLSELAGERIG